MRDRRFLWADAKIQKLVMENFIPASDEVWRLQNRDGLDSKVFMRFADEGHYRGRGNTRQGIYVATPSGKFLGSNNNRDPRVVERMLRAALKKWRETPVRERYLKEDPGKAQIRHPRDGYPDGGLILRVFSRDLPRTDMPDDWRKNAWNQDYLWYRKDEAKNFLPGRPKKGMKFDVPKALIERMAINSFLDNVRGQTITYRASAVETAELRGTVKSIRRGIVEIVLTGKTKASQDGRGMELKIRGTAKYDWKKQVFKEFELVAVGTRFGQTRFNFRRNESERAPIGFVVRLAGDERVSPAHMQGYGW